MTKCQLCGYVIQRHKDSRHLKSCVKKESDDKGTKATMWMNSGHYSCKLCQKSMKSSLQLSEHLMQMHSMSCAKCQLCGHSVIRKSFEFQRQLQNSSGTKKLSWAKRGIITFLQLQLDGTICFQWRHSDVPSFLLICVWYEKKANLYKNGPNRLKTLFY